MGYTHYFHRVEGEEINDTQWEEITTKTKKLAAAVMGKGIALTAYNEKAGDTVIISEPSELIVNFHDDDETITAIHLNGDYRTDDDHETLFIEKKATDDFNFCKTARKPYNVLVGAVLIVANNILGDSFKISSDGDSNEQEWIDSLALVNELFPDEEYQLNLREDY